jgi:uncharacterized protein (DUF1810 family)
MSDDLERFVQAQEGIYDVALQEIRQGHKQSHWMWFVFPQLRGLGRSALSHRYGIRDLQEARDYLAHPVLGRRLAEITQAVEDSGVDLKTMFGEVDALKFVSCMTLFAHAAPGDSIFSRLLQTLPAPDARTEQMLGQGG